MSLWRRHEPAQDEQADVAPLSLEQEAEQARELDQQRQWALAHDPGTQYCSSRGCSEETGMACSYVDRRERSCPTAWCPEHRVVAHDAIYCRVHASLIEGTAGGFGELSHPDFENRVPAVVNWVARDLQDDVWGMIERMAVEFREDIVIDPVRFVLFGVERIRTWDRSWKVCSHHGVSLRVAVAVEEAKPNLVLGKVNSKTVISMEPPWHEEHGVGREPDSVAEGERAVMEFHGRLFFGLARAVEEWRVAEHEKRADEEMQHAAALEASYRPFAVGAVPRADPNVPDPQASTVTAPHFLNPEDGPAATSDPALSSGSDALPG